jgi:NMD protein affecting ribosome stability and mRNA decay
MRCNKCGKDISAEDHYEGNMSRVEYIPETKSFVVIDTVHLNLCDDCYFINDEQEFKEDGKELTDGTTKREETTDNLSAE